MKIETISCVEQAIEQGRNLTYIYFREYSRVVIGEMPITFNEEQLLEARFFNENCEIRLFRTEQGLCAVKLTADPQDQYIEHRRAIANPKLFGEQLITRDYLAPDEDGQMCVAQTCMAGWKGGKALG